MRSIWIVIISILITSGLIGGSVFYLVDAKATKDKNTLQSEITDLNKKVVATEKSLAIARASATSATTNSTITSTSSVNHLYQNDDLGFSFTIPTDYTIQLTRMYEGASGVVIRFAKESSALVSDYNFAELTLYQDSTTLDKLTTSYQKNNSDILKTFSIKIDGTDATKYEVGGLAGGFHIIGTNGKLVLTMDHYPSGDSNFIDQVLSTLKFTK